MATAEAPTITDPNPQASLETPSEKPIIPNSPEYWAQFQAKKEAKRVKFQEALMAFQKSVGRSSRNYQIILEAERLTDKKVTASYTFTDGSVIEGLCLGLTKYYGETVFPVSNNVIIRDPVEGTVTIQDIEDITSITTEPGAYDNAHCKT